MDFLVDLPAPVMLVEGDGFLLEDGRVVAVELDCEPLAELRVASDGQLVRLAWHLGNRHLPAKVGERVIRIQRDAVIEDMARRLGAEIAHIEAPFDPEAAR